MKWILILTGAVSVCGTAACVLANRIEPQSARPRSGSIQERFMGRGVVSPRQGVVEVHALIDGKVIAVQAQEGDTVRKNQLLTELQPLGIDSEVDRIEAEKGVLEANAQIVDDGARPEEISQLQSQLASARAELGLANDEVERDQRLTQTGAVAPESLQRTWTSAQTAQARVAMFEARLRLAVKGKTPAERRAAHQRVAAAAAALRHTLEQRDWARVVSPIDGTLLARHVDVGDSAYAGPLGTSLFEIANVSNPELRIEIEESDSPRISVGLTVALHFAGHQTASTEGKITRVSPKLESRAVGVPGARDRADALVRVAWADFDIHRFESPPAIGQRFDVEVRLPPVDARTIVPRSAVRIDEGRALVEVKSGFGWKNMEVQLGLDDGRAIAVEGLPSDAIIRIQNSGSLQ